MELALNEMKIQSKKLLKQFNLNRVESQVVLKLISKQKLLEMQLKHAQHVVALYYGFADWQHAHQVLSAKNNWQEAMRLGSIFYSSACQALTNHWFSDYTSASEMLAKLGSGHFLVPYKHQYLVVQTDFMSLVMDLTSAQPWLEQLDKDLVKGYGSREWDQLALNALRHRALQR